MIAQVCTTFYHTLVCSDLNSRDHLNVVQQLIKNVRKYFWKYFYPNKRILITTYRALATLVCVC